MATVTKRGNMITVTGCTKSEFNALKGIKGARGVNDTVIVSNSYEEQVREILGNPGNDGGIPQPMQEPQPQPQPQPQPEEQSETETEITEAESEPETKHESESETETASETEDNEPETEVETDDDEETEEATEPDSNITMEQIVRSIAKEVSKTAENDALKRKIEALSKEIKALKKEIAAQPKKVEYEVKVGDIRKIKFEHKLHPIFEKVLEYVSLNIPVYLHGPAGCGKNVLCSDLAKALGLEFSFTGCVRDEYKLTGFFDAQGRFVPTQFVNAFRDGKFFMFDEMDGSIPDALIAINAAISNGYLELSDKTIIEAHENFRIVACGNTIGHGSENGYTGRQPIDISTLDRFVAVEMDYDEDVELAICNNDREMVEFFHDIRKCIKGMGLYHTVSMRAMIYMMKMNFRNRKNDDERRSLMKEIVLKGIAADDVQMLRENMDSSNYFVKFI